MDKELMLSVLEEFFSQGESTNLVDGLHKLSDFAKEKAQKIAYERDVKNILTSVKHMDRWRPKWIKQAQEWINQIRVQHIVSDGDRIKESVVLIAPKITMEIQTSMPRSWMMVGGGRIDAYNSLYSRHDSDPLDNIPFNLWLGLLKKVVKFFGFNNPIDHYNYGTISGINSPTNAWYAKPKIWHVHLNYLSDDLKTDQTIPDSGLWINIENHLPIFGKRKKKFIFFLISKISLHFTIFSLLRICTKELRKEIDRWKNQKWECDSKVWKRRDESDYFFIPQKKNFYAQVHQKGEPPNLLLLPLQDGKPITDKAKFFIEWLLYTSWEVECSWSDDSRVDEEFLRDNTVLGKLVELFDGARRILSIHFPKVIVPVITNYYRLNTSSPLPLGEFSSGL